MTTDDTIDLSRLEQRIKYLNSSASHYHELYNAAKYAGNQGMATCYEKLHNAVLVDLGKLIEDNTRFLRHITQSYTIKNGTFYVDPPLSDFLPSASAKI